MEAIKMQSDLKQPYVGVFVKKDDELVLLFLSLGIGLLLGQKLF